MPSRPTTGTHRRDSFRITGAKIVWPRHLIARGPYYHSIVYDPGLTAKLVTRTAYPATDRVPAALVIGGAATAIGATDVFTDPGLATPGGGVAGARLLVLTEAAALADGSRVVEVRSLDGGSPASSGRLASPRRDSTPVTLYDYDAPGALIGPNGDYVFDTFR